MAKREKTWSLKEIDQGRSDVKGTAFLAFKQLQNALDEGHDFYYLSAAEDADEIDGLRRAGRIYEGTVNAVLFTEAGYDALLDYLDD